MKKQNKITKLTEQDIGKIFTSNKRKILITDSFQSLFLGEDTNTNEEFTFYNTGEPTSINCNWLRR